MTRFNATILSFRRAVDANLAWLDPLNRQF